MSSLRSFNKLKLLASSSDIVSFDIFEVLFPYCRMFVIDWLGPTETVLCRPLGYWEFLVPSSLLPPIRRITSSC